jgi:antirestriction protein ArdC
MPLAVEHFVQIGARLPIEAPWRAPEAAEIVLANSGVVVRIGGDRAFYSPATDHIQMPPQAAFATVLGYCRALIHEMSALDGRAVAAEPRAAQQLGLA